MREQLIQAYLDYRNNYLTIHCWSEANGLTDDEGMELISLARKVFEHEHPDA